MIKKIFCLILILCFYVLGTTGPYIFGHYNAFKAFKNEVEVIKKCDNVRDSTINCYGEKWKEFSKESDSEAVVLGLSFIARKIQSRRSKIKELNDYKENQKYYMFESAVEICFFTRHYLVSSENRRLESSLLEKTILFPKYLVKYFIIEKIPVESKRIIKKIQKVLKNIDQDVLDKYKGSQYDEAYSFCTD